MPTMADALCGLAFFSHSDLDLWVFDLKIAVPVTADVHNLARLNVVSFSIFRLTVGIGLMDAV